MNKKIRAFVCLLLCSFLFVPFSYSQVFDWEWQNSKPAGVNWNDAVILTNGNYVLFGDKGSIATSSDAGATWAVKYVDTAFTNRNIYEADFVNNLTGYLCGTGGLLMKTTDGGTSWTSLTSGITTDFWYIDAVDADTAYACGSSAVLLKTTDGGSTWNSISLGTTTGTIYTVFVLTPQKIFLGTSSATIGRLAVSNDYGATFAPVAGYTSTSLIRSIYFHDETRGFVGNSSYQLFTTTDGGATFTSVDFGTGTLYEIKFFDSVNGAAAGANGQVFLTGDGGATWDTTNTGFTGANNYSLTLKGNSQIDAFDDILIAGEGGAISKTIDFGVNYTALSQTATTETLRDIDFPTETTGYAVGGSTTASDVLKTTDGGLNWVKTPFDGGYRLYSQTWINETTGWVGRRGPDGIFKSTDGGLTFTQQNPGVGTSTTIWYDIKFADANNGYAAGSSGYYVKTTDGGTTWSEVTDGHGTSAIYSLWALSSTTVISAGSSGKIYKTTDGGATFTSIGGTFTTTLYSVCFVDENLGFVVGTSGNGYKTTDGGATWNAMTVPVTSTLYKINFFNANIGWIAGSTGSVLYTTDGGTVWIKSAKFPSGSVMYDIAIRGSYLWIAGSVGVIIRGFSDPQIPVELVSFAANVDEGMVTLNWSTATETNNRGFEIERRFESSQWENVGFVPGAGTSTEFKAYSYLDSPSADKVYYRLKQVDFDGSFEYSNEIEVNLNIPLEFALEQNYPNPFNPATTINYSIAKAGLVSVKIYNTLGEEVMQLVNTQQQPGRYSVKFNASNLTSGIYFYQIKSGDFVSVKKMMLLK